MFTLMKNDKSIGIEIRSIRVDGKCLYETSWPDLGEITINDKKHLDLKPLQNNSSLKKRKDEKIFVESIMVKEGNNKITIREFHPSHD